MAVTITQHPSSISFAGNPVLLKVYSNLSEKTFLKVCAEVTVDTYLRSTRVGQSVHPLSIPTEGGSGTVVFNLSDPLQSALSQITLERSSALTNGDISYSGGHVIYSVKVWDEYLDEYSEIVSTKNTASAESERRVALPGAYTGMQRLTLPEDTASYLGTARILSCKPDGEAVPVGGKVTVPLFSTTGGATGVYMDVADEAHYIDSHFLYENETSWQSHRLSVEGLHALVFSDISVSPFFVYVVPEHPFARYFEFVNRLGAVESIYTFGRAQLKTGLTQERQVRNRDVSFRPTARYVKRTLQEEQTLELSTGTISREWAKWFVQEFFAAETAWMRDAGTNDLIPVIVEADEAISIYNESEAEVLDLPFKVVMCING